LFFALALLGWLTPPVALSAENWLSPEERKFFSMFSTRIRLDEKLVKNSGSFRRLPQLVKTAPQPFRQRLESLILANQKMMLSEVENYRYAELMAQLNGLNQPDFAAVNNVRLAMTNNLTSMMFGGTPESFAKEMFASVYDNSVGKSNARAAEANKTRRALNELELRYVKRVSAAIEEREAIVLAIFNDVKNRSHPKQFENTRLSLTNINRDICLKIENGGEGLVDPILRIACKRQPSVNGIFPMPANIKPGSVAFVFLGVTTTYAQLFQGGLDVTVLTANGWFDDHNVRVSSGNRSKSR